VSAGTFTVEQHCPQCGAPVTIEEADRFFSCDHCRVRLYISGEGVQRYSIPPSGRESELFFVPYWHLRGAHFLLKPLKLDCKVLDATFRAGGPEGLPLTLGVRAQAMKLRHAVEVGEGIFLKPKISYDAMIPKALKLSRSFGRGRDRERLEYQAFLPSRASLIYTPLYRRGMDLYDAVLDRPRCRLPEGTEELPGEPDDPGTWRMKYLAALCPNCGWDLPGEKKSIVLLCGSCKRAWHLSPGRFLETPFAVFPGGREGDVYLPFWRIFAAVEGLPLSTYGDLVKLANLPLAVRPEWEEKKVSFWSPAFQLRPRIFLRLSRQLTALPPDECFDETIADGASAYAVTLDVREAFESVKLVIAGMAVPKKAVFPLLPDLKVTFAGARLHFMPFAVQGGDFIQRQIRLSIRRNALRP
jgi:hypothetical protein